MSMNWQDLAQTISEGSESGAITFPQSVKLLMEAGFDGYAVDFRHGTRTYYFADSETLEVKTPPVAAVAARFDAAALRAALREAQALVPGYTYRGFCEKAAAAGSAGYMVSIPGKRVLYYGRSGETHTEYFPGTQPKAEARDTARSITKTVRIDRAPEAVFDFLADLANWPRWAVVNVKATCRTADPDWWNMVTPRGEAKLRLRGDASRGILDHDFVDAQASWTVPARVVRNGGGAEFMITFFQPPGFSDAFFDEQIKLVDIELAQLKALLEAAPMPAA